MIKVIRDRQDHAIRVPITNHSAVQCFVVWLTFTLFWLPFHSNGNCNGSALAQMSASGLSGRSSASSPLAPLMRTQGGPPVTLNNDFGMWLPSMLQYPLTKNRRLQVYQEIQPRFTRQMERLDQVQIRENLLYVINRRSDIQCGYTFTRNYLPAVFDDHRVQQQFSSVMPFRRFAFYNRSRLEERFIEHRDGEVSVRFRHYTRLTYRLYRERFYTFTANELFINLNNVNNGPSSGIDQNRLLTGVGVRLYKQLRFDVGYMNQYLNPKGNRDKMNHILYLGVSQNF